MVAWLVGALPLAALVGPWAGVGAVFAFRLFVALLVVVAGFRGRRSRASVAVVMLAAIWLGVGACTTLSTRGGQWTELASVALGSGAVWAVFRLRHDAPLVALVRGWAVAIAVATPMALWEIVTARHLSTYIGGDWANHPGTYHEPATWLTNPNLFGVLTATAVPLLAVGARRDVGRWRVVEAITSLLALGLLVATSSRLAMAALGLAVLVRAMGAPRWRWVVLAASVLGCLLLLGLDWSSVRLSVHRVVGVIVHHSDEGPSSLSVRAALVAVGLHLVDLHPLMGTGPGGFERAVRAGGLPWHTYGKVNPHNGVLEIASQYGLPVTGLLAAAVLVAVILVLARTRGGWRWWVPALVVALPVLSMCNSTYLVQSVTQLVWVLLAALVCHALDDRGPDPTTAGSTAEAVR